ncbi:MAG: PhzF family phenazine biosynthesis protein [Hyphomicrobiales bacterium]|nr:PhzF family phenazine biosynthesis protein [Hyphomicrobiales bacterium]
MQAHLNRPRRYVTADVFSDHMFQGNPVAVVLDAQGLSPEQMLVLAKEFNYVESTFVLPPGDPAHTARVRIFTPVREVPFAGHPNIGTAFLLGREAAEQGKLLRHVIFEEEAGLVPIDLMWEDEALVGAELTCPEPFSRRRKIAVEQAAACLSLDPSDIRNLDHEPQVVSVGLPFLVVELSSRDALRRARPDKAAYARVLPVDGAHSIYAYTRFLDPGESDCDLQARMFTSYMVEDPATGSATAAVSALLAEIRGSSELRLRVRQGVDMGRPSTLLTRVTRQDGEAPIVKLGGRCVSVMAGTLQNVARPDL